MRRICGVLATPGLDLRAIGAKTQVQVGSCTQRFAANRFCAPKAEETIPQRTNNHFVLSCRVAPTTRGNCAMHQRHDLSSLGRCGNHRINLNPKPGETRAMVGKPRGGNTRSLKSLELADLELIVRTSFKTGVFKARQIRGTSIGNQLSPVLSSLPVLLRERQWRQSWEAQAKESELGRQAFQNTSPATQVRPPPRPCQPPGNWQSQRRPPGNFTPPIQQAPPRPLYTGSVPLPYPSSQRKVIRHPWPKAATGNQNNGTHVAESTGTTSRQPAFPDRQSAISGTV